MKRFATTVIAWFVVFASAVPSRADIAPGDLATLVTQELQPESLRPAIDPALKARVGAKSSVLVAGVLGELLPGYFSHNAESLRDDFGQKNVTILRPLTCDAESDNAAKLDTELRKAAVGAQPGGLLVLGHSKGGAETLLTLLKDPALVRDGIVDRLVLISGAVGGSGVAGIHGMPGGDKICPGVQDLRRDHSPAIFAAALGALSDDDRALLSSRVFYVRAAKDPQDVALVFKGSAKYLSEHFGANDGMMLPEDEMLPNFGTDLGILVADHSDLVGWGPYTGSPAEMKRAFTRAVVRAVYGD